MLNRDRYKHYLISKFNLLFIVAIYRHHNTGNYTLYEHVKSSIISGIFNEGDKGISSEDFWFV